MAKKAGSSKGDRTDPKQNKSLAIRNVLQNVPNATVKEVVQSVKNEYGHKVSTAMVYMIKAKSNMKNGSKAQRVGPRAKATGAKPSPMNSAATWVKAIKIGREFLAATGNIENATALLKAISS